MLLEFRASNYKSFQEELVFSLIPAPKQKGLDYSVLKILADKKQYKGLCSAVIYGPNASGKTNIISAMDAFKSIVLRGNIRNDANSVEPNVAARMLQLIPNYANSVPKPVMFSITFIESGLHINYSFSLDIGGFMDSEYKRKVLSESLKINKNLIFDRNEGLYFNSLEKIQDFFVNALEQNIDSAIELAKSNLHDEELFLANGFKTMFSSRLVAIITDWLEKKFMVIYRADSMRISRKFSDPKEPQIQRSQRGFNLY